MGGRVTANTCRPGRTLASGEIAARIGGTPIIALATPVPLYRDLHQGSEGRDVQALQRELGRLGYIVAVDGVFGEQTKTAVQELQESLGISPHDGVIHHRRILWLPNRTVVPDSCKLIRGAYMTAR
ncbi:MAG: peptidoglycan-binding domain-containing protein [Nocardioidaceae bacterium]